MNFTPKKVCKTAPSFPASTASLEILDRLKDWVIQSQDPFGYALPYLKSRFPLCIRFCCLPLGFLFMPIVLDHMHLLVVAENIAIYLGFKIPSLAKVLLMVSSTWGSSIWTDLSSSS